MLDIDYPAGTDSTSYTYDSLGNVADGADQWHRQMDLSSTITAICLIDESLTVDGSNSDFTYGYDANAALASITYPDGKRIDYAPDALGRPTKAGAFATGVSYLPDGSVHGFFFGNGAEYLATKNARQLLSNLTVSDKTGALVYSQDMTYDANANLLSTTDLTPSATRTEVLSYDNLNRLTRAEADNQWGVETYTYDALNNIRSISSDGLDRVYSYNSNNLLSSIVSRHQYRKLRLRRPGQHHHARQRHAGVRQGQPPAAGGGQGQLRL